MFVKEKAYAKINLYLDIEQKRQDGFHDIITVMQLISLHDEVNIVFNGTQEINLTITNMDLGIPNDKNIAYIAACKFYENLDTNGYSLAFNIDEEGEVKTESAKYEYQYDANGRYTNVYEFESFINNGLTYTSVLEVSFVWTK